MKAISLWQPWASALFTRLKLDETRSWILPAWAVGVPVAIQAAKKFTFNERSAFEIRVIPGSPEHTAFQTIGINTPDDLPLGCIVGEVIFAPAWMIGARSVQDRTYAQREWGDYSAGRFAWPVMAATWFKEPVPCVGRQGFFNWNPSPTAPKMKKEGE